MGFLGDLWGKTIGTVINSGNNVIQTFTGSKKDREKYGHQEFSDVQKSFSAEFYNRSNRTLWDSFWDGLNRMPRPLFVVLVVAYFVLSYVNPGEFQIINIGLETVPDKMWYVLSAIIGFYFCARELHKIREVKAQDPKEFEEMQKRIHKLRSISKPKEIKNKSIEDWKLTNK